MIPRKIKKAATAKPTIKANNKLMWDFLSPTGVFWATVGIILGLVGTYYLFRQDFSIEPEAPLDPQNPLRTEFRITNAGKLPVYDLDRSSIIHAIHAQNIAIDDVGVINAAPRIPKLSSGESTTLFIPTFPNVIIPITPAAPFTLGDLEVVIKYKTLILGRRKETSSRFSIRQLADGSYQWFHKSKFEP